MDEFDNIIGLSPAQAKKFHKNIRVVKADGESLSVDRSFNPQRMNVEVKMGKIIKILDWS